MRSRAVFALALAAALLGPLAPRVWAHEGEEDLPARTLVEQAILLLRTQPGALDAIQDKIRDALEAEDAEGVDLELVAAAEEELGLGRLHAVQDLLEVAIGAAPHQVVASPNPGPGLPVPGAAEPEPEPVLHERALEGDDEPIDGAPVLLGLAVLLGVVGFVIVRRTR